MQKDTLLQNNNESVKLVEAFKANKEAVLGLCLIGIVLYLNRRKK